MERKIDLYNLNLTDVKDEGDNIKVCFKEAKNKRNRTFFVGNEKSEQMDVISLVKEYLNIRLALKFKANAFFMQIRHIKAVGQRVGIITFGDNCKIVAKFLHLDHPETYTSHCGRRSSTTDMAENGVPFIAT